jgi:hypothetical protein
MRALLVTKESEPKGRKLVNRTNMGEVNRAKKVHYDHILSLQRNIGNQALLHLFESGIEHAKQKKGEPNDKYDQWAYGSTGHIMRTADLSLQTHENVQEFTGGVEPKRL